MAQVYVGNSGYQYKHWKTLFYPQGLPTARWFDYFRSRFATVEINTTFYRLPRKEAFSKWREKAPLWFVYTLKYSRFATHVKKLKDTPATLARFLDNAAPLLPRVAAILVQLPPGWKKDAERLKNFFAAAPGRIRWAFEFRNPSWLCDEVYAILRRYNSALVIHDLIKPHPEVVTADWMYLRFHGGEGTGGYPPEALSAAADRIRSHAAAGREVYVYFNNDRDAQAVFNAEDLIRLLQKRRVDVLRPQADRS